MAIPHAWEGAFVAELSTSRRVEVVRRCADAAELASAAAAGLGDFAVVAAGLAGLDRSFVADLAGHGVSVLGVSERGDEGQERSLRQLGIVRVTRSDAACAQVEQALAALRDASVREASWDAPWDAARDGGVLAAEPAWPAKDALPLMPRNPTRADGDPRDVTRAVAGGGPGGSLDAGHSVEGLPLIPPSLLQGVSLPEERRAPEPASESERDREGEAAVTMSTIAASDRAAGVDVASEPARSAEHPGGRLVAVWGPGGAPGRSTVALALASEAAELGLRALLIDADPYGGVQAQALSILDEGPGLAGAVRAADAGTLDVPALIGWCRGVGPGLSVLTGIPRAQRWPELRADPLEHVLRMTRSVADLIVVDCGFCLEDDEELSYDTLAPRRNAATLTALSAADRVVVVGAGDPIGLQRLSRGLADLDALELTASRSIVVNRVRASAIGRRPEASISAALRRFAAVPTATFIPEDRAALDRAVLSGRTLAECAPGSAARRALVELAADVCRGLTPTRRSRRLDARGRRTATDRPQEAHRV